MSGRSGCGDMLMEGSVNTNQSTLIECPRCHCEHEDKDTAMGLCKECEDWHADDLYSFQQLMMEIERDESDNSNTD